MAHNGFDKMSGGSLGTRLHSGRRERSMQIPTNVRQVARHSFYFLLDTFNNRIMKNKMSEWTEREHGDIKIKHHSTSSLIKMTITTEEEVEQGKWEKVKQTVWFDYKTFSDLREVVSQTDFP